MDGQLLAGSQHCSVYLVPQPGGQVVRKQLFGSLANFQLEVSIHRSLAKAYPDSFPALINYDEARKELVLEYCERQAGMSAFDLALKSLQAVKAMHDLGIIHGNLSSRSLLPTGTGLKLTGLKSAHRVRGNEAVFMEDLASLGMALSSVFEEQVPISVRLIVELLTARLNLKAETLLVLLMRSNQPLNSSLHEARVSQVAEALIRSCQTKPFPQEEVMQLLEQYKEVIQVSGLISLKQSGVTCIGCQERLAESDLATLHCIHRLCRLCVKKLLRINSCCPCGQPFNFCQEGVAPFVSLEDFQRLMRVSVKCPHCGGLLCVERKREKHQCVICGRFFCACCLKTKH